MAVICDTGGVYALYDADDDCHAAVKAVVEHEPGPLFLPTILLAEIDYLLHARLGVDAALDFLESLEAEAFELVHPATTDIPRCRELMVRYRDLQIGLADASVVAAAERLKINRLLTVDERHFRAIEPHGLGYFVLLPADEPPAAD